MRLYRPFDTCAFVEALPITTERIAVLDRTKEPGSSGEPLYLDSVTALYEEWSGSPKVIGGRYGLSSKEFTPAMVKGVFDNLAQEQPKNHFTIGINDDVSQTSLEYDPEFSIEPDDIVRAVFYGLGSDGTVGANKNSIKIIGENTPNYTQGYFVYNSKKSGSMTISHLRFGPHPIHAPYLISKANFVACHQPNFLERFDVLQEAAPGGVFLLNIDLRCGGRVGTPAAARPGAIDCQALAFLRDRRLESGARQRHGRTDQHGHAGLFLRHFRRVAA